MQGTGIKQINSEKDLARVGRSGRKTKETDILIDFNRTQRRGLEKKHMLLRSNPASDGYTYLALERGRGSVGAGANEHIRV